MSREFWYISRASGIVAVVLIVASLLWGFLFSSRDTGTRLRPAWWLDLHTWLGGLAVIFTGVHVLASVLQSDSGIGLSQVFIPGTASLDRWGITWGVLATYLLAAVVFTTWPRRLGNRLWWRIVHLTSVAATGLAILHSYQSGSDATRSVFQIGLLVSVGVATYGVFVRLLGLKPRFGAHRKSTASRRSEFSQPALRSLSSPSDGSQVK